MKVTFKSILLFYLIYEFNCTEHTIYTTKYDNANLDEILATDRLLTGYINCLLDQGPCTPDGKELKKNLPDAIQNNCKKCSERQKEGGDQVMHYIIDHRPEDWIKLEQKYNSDGSYKSEYLQGKNIEKEEEKDDKISENKDDEDEKND